MNENRRSLSQFKMSLKVFTKNRLALLCLVVLGVFYLAAIFADLFSPYSYDNEDPDVLRLITMGLGF